MAAHKDADSGRSKRHRPVEEARITPRYPDLLKALASLPARSFILDGEVAVYDQAHISRFEGLRARPKAVRAALPV